MNSIARKIFTTRCVHTCTTLLREKPNNLKGRSHSSQLWLERQLRDPYVEKAKQYRYRCRSAFKLLEINEKYHIFNHGDVVIDCGAAPGSWTQVAVKLVNADEKQKSPVGKVIAIDKFPINIIEGAIVLGHMDFTKPTSQMKLKDLLKDTKATVVLSDMAPNATGVKELDHENIITLAYAAMKFALEVTCTDGTFVVKIWDGVKTNQLKNDLAMFYKKVKTARPEATRSESAETYIIASGFKGLKVPPPPST